MYLTLGGQGILVINTLRVAADLLDRRSHIYGDRPRMISKCRLGADGVLSTYL